jgi:hypothetical protein
MQFWGLQAASLPGSFGAPIAAAIHVPQLNLFDLKQP